MCLPTTISLNTKGVESYPPYEIVEVALAVKVSSFSSLVSAPISPAISKDISSFG